MYALVVDDEPASRKLLRFLLEQQPGTVVSEAASGAEALDLLKSTPHDVVILDIIMPEMDGFDLCRKIRTISNVPILMVSARTQLGDRVKGLQLGADDYLCKPFDPTELMARTTALLRRTRRSSLGPVGQVRVGTAAIDLVNHTVTLDERGPLSLTDTEFRFFLCLACSPGKVWSRRELSLAVWGLETDPSANTIDSYVADLRRKIERDSQDPRHIITVRGKGYIFE